MAFSKTINFFLPFHLTCLVCPIAAGRHYAIFCPWEVHSWKIHRPTTLVVWPKHIPKLTLKDVLEELPDRFPSNFQISFTERYFKLLHNFMPVHPPKPYLVHLNNGILENTKEKKE